MKAMEVYNLKYSSVSPDHKFKSSDSFNSGINLNSYLKYISLVVMIKTILFFSIMLILSVNLLSQPVIEEWVRRYPDTVNGWGSGNAITVDNKGYVYVTGTIVISNLMKYGLSIVRAVQ